MSLESIALLSSVVAGGATVILAILTGIYVRLTGRLVEEMKASREPAVFIDFEHFQRTANLCIGNYGGAPAIDVTFDLDDLGAWESEFIAPGQLNALRQGISYLPPGRILKYELSRVDWDKARDEGSKVVVDIKYENEAGKEFHRTVDFDFVHYYEVKFASFNDPVDHLTRAVRDLTKTLQDQTDS